MTTTVLAYLPSPSQGVWHLGPVPIRAYALCIIVGIIAALVIGDRRWQARGGQAGVIYDIALWAVPFGLVGGRLYHVMTDWPTYFGPGGKGLGAAFQVWQGGLGIWGAVALGGVGAGLAAARGGYRCRPSATRSHPESSWRRPSAGSATTSTKSSMALTPRCRGAWRSTSAYRTT
ncbi:prolipoprotein diacylglyceryl transferase [Mycolicibacterium conceptionense]|uniref:Prolipoprotein diacylglyceryl transferase n=1 Tax=Mycolicibacterium conceptionense TaxID=451644 RepID=A0A0U1DEN2_9MYCO|nr:prolipoprotein diacylglyceryl transferase [Mycolicibacterium conceptionense]